MTCKARPFWFTCRSSHFAVGSRADAMATTPLSRWQWNRLGVSCKEIATEKDPSEGLSVC